MLWLKVCFRLQIVSIAHSHVSLDGQELEGKGKEYLGVVVRDTKQKGFFIRIVDPEVHNLYKPHLFRYRLNYLGW